MEPHYYVPTGGLPGQTELTTDRAAAGNVFTTHTPVPAGIDRFQPELVEKYLSGFVSGAEVPARRGAEVPAR